MECVVRDKLPPSKTRNGAEPLVANLPPRSSSPKCEPAPTNEWQVPFPQGASHGRDFPPLPTSQIPCPFPCPENILPPAAAFPKAAARLFADDTVVIFP